MSKRNSYTHFLRRRNGWTLWEQWVLATAAAELVGLSIIAGVSAISDSFENMSIHGIVLMVGILQGAVLGFAQWLVLRRYIHKMALWVIATTVAAAIAWVIGLAASIVMALAYADSVDATTPVLILRNVVLLGAWVGSVLGFAQWIVLRTHHIRKAVWWVFANALAWALGLGVAFIGVGIQKSEEFSVKTALTGAVTGGAMGAIVGAVTGIALVWLLRRRLGRRRD